MACPGRNIEVYGTVHTNENVDGDLMSGRFENLHEKFYII
jgi:hypothetical protein